MKKVESVLNGLPGWGKNRPAARFPQTLFCLLSLILTKIFTIKVGKRGASAYNLPVEALLKRLSGTNLTLPILLKGGKK